MRIQANTPEEYIEKLPEERKEAFRKLRQIILENLPKGFEETITYDMPSYVVPHKFYPDGYHVNPEIPLPFINIASQKNHIAFYHLGLYNDPELSDWFRREYPNHSKTRLDMGKSCIRWKKPEHIPYDLIGELVSRMDHKKWISIYESNVKR